MEALDRCQQGEKINRTWGAVPSLRAETFVPGEGGEVAGDGGGTLRSTDDDDGIIHWRCTLCQCVGALLVPVRKLLG